MSTVRDKVRERILEINNTCADITDYIMQQEDHFGCHLCPNDNACTFLLAFDEWWHMKSHRKAGDEDLERLVDAVMTVEDYEDLLEVNI